MSTSPASSSISPTRKPQLPTPQELVSHYESQGLSTQEASFKAIDDLQNTLVRVISSSSKSARAKKMKLMEEASLKLDTANARLAILEKKVDDFPFSQIIAIGVASSATYRGIVSVWPMISSSALKIWNSIRGATQP